MFFRHRKQPLKQRLSDAIFKIKLQSDRLGQTLNRLQQRDAEIFEKCVAALTAKDELKATIYANECAEIRKIAKIIMRSQLALEQVMLRLQTIEELGDVMATMAPVLHIVRETKKELSGVVPEVANELEEVNKLLNSTMSEIGHAPMQEPSIEAVSAEAMRVLEEAAALSEEGMKEKFPELPEIPSKAAPIAEAEAEAPAAEAEQAGEHAPPPIDLKSIEGAVYEYVKRHDGEVDVGKLSAELRVPPRKIYEALESLQRSGKIKIA